MDPLDVAVRHQAYIEAVKNYEQEAFDPTAEALAVLLVFLLAKWGYDRISDMPKRVLLGFVAEFNRRADKLLNPFRKSFTKELRDFTRIDALITSLNFATLTGKPAYSPTSASTWAAAKNELVGGTGQMPLVMLRDFLRYTKGQLGQFVRRAYSEKWTAHQMVLALRGTKEKRFRDGMLHKLKVQFNSLQSTLIQHFHTWLQYQFGKHFYSHYEWVSVLDSRTTEVCRSRAGKVYEYGKGPLPPAHYNCRSTIVGIAQGVPLVVPNRFYDWLSKQPTQIQNDILGQDRAKKLRAGKLTADDLPKFDGTRKIAPKDLSKKQQLMVK